MGSSLGIFRYSYFFAFQWESVPGLGVQWELGEGKESKQAQRSLAVHCRPTSWLFQSQDSHKTMQ